VVVEERIVGAARAAFEQQFCDRTLARLGEHCAQRLEDLAASHLLADLKADPGRVGLETLLGEIDKLDAIASLRLRPTRGTSEPPHFPGRFIARVGIAAAGGSRLIRPRR
jgi:hypothetical protein